MLDHWVVKGDRTCTFVFKVAKNEGVLAVIHKMFFRYNGSQCLDYVQVSDTSDKFDDIEEK